MNADPRLRDSSGPARGGHLENTSLAAHLQLSLEQGLRMQEFSLLKLDEGQENKGVGNICTDKNLEKVKN